MEKITQNAGRNALGKFATAFAHYNDDILFGENWNDDGIDLKTRCIITLTSLISQGISDSSLDYHLENAKKAGVTRKEIAAIITHIAFYAGWPKAWSAFGRAKDIWREEDKTDFENNLLFPLGQPNDAYADYFIGQSYLAPLSTKQVGIFNVTFEPSCRNNWHIHKADEGGGQILLCIAGEGYYQEWGEEARKLKAGDVVNIPANVKHWHGAAKDSWFSHLAIEVPGKNSSTIWLEAVEDKEYTELA